MPSLISVSLRFQVFDIGRNERIPITGLEFFRVPASHKYIVLASSPDHLYKFTETVRPDERSPFQAIFRAYTLETTEFLKTSSQRFAASSAPTKLLRLCYDPSNHFPRSVAVLTAHDILHSELDASANTQANIVDTTHVPFPERESADGQKTRSISPVAFTLTDFHAILVYTDHLVAISLLDYSIVYEEYFSDRFGSLLDVVRDAQTKAVYVYSTKKIFRLNVVHERRHVWRIYMDLGRLDQALAYAGDNPRSRDIVLSRTAEMKFNSGLYLEAAAIYAETMTSFETVCLKYLELGQMEALRVFLRKKLVTLPAQDRTQITMLVVWLVELYLTEIAKQREGGDATAVALQREFDEFMRIDRVLECTRKNTRVIYDLMASHGDCNNLAALTAVNNDFEAVVGQFVHQQKWQEALKVLRQQRKPELFYKFAPILMEAVPKETVAALMEQRDSLEASKLLPTLICLESGAGDKHVKEVVQYLEFAIHSLGTTEMALHNYLIRLLAEHSREKLLPFLETQGKDVTQLHYDKQYALRVCKEWRCHEACVFLQCLLGLWTEAIELALTFNVELAKEKANLPTAIELRRKLWLRIAEHEIKGRAEQEEDVRGALELLKACKLLRIEDILPHFNDFERIDHFKVAICEALQEYNLRIQEQKKDMAEAERSAERVRQELQMFRERSVAVGADDLCGACATFVLQRPCFVFPCGHKLHADCLEREVVQGGKEGGRLSILKQRMAATEGTKEFAKHRADYEDLLAGDCIYCGQTMIEAIDQPFVDDWERVNSDWA